MNLKQRLKDIRDRVAKSKALRALFVRFVNSQIIPAELLSDEVLKMVIANFIKRAEEKGYTAGIDLPENEIAEYLLKIIRGESVNFKEATKAQKVVSLIEKSLFNR